MEKFNLAEKLLDEYEAGNNVPNLIDAISTKEAESAKTSWIKIIDAFDFMSLELPPRENILAPWLPCQGLAMIYAPRGVGKTYVTLSIAYAVTSGASVFGWQADKPRGVLYIDGEMPASVLQERLAKISFSNNQEPAAPLRFYTPDLQETPRMINLAGADDQMELQGHLEGIELIIVDTISTLCKAGRENEGESWLPIQTWALQQRAARRSVLFIHHAGKNGEQRGTSRREDVLDTVISLKHPGDYTPDRGANFEVHFEKSRGIYGDATKPFEAQLTQLPDDKLQWLTKPLEESTVDKVAKLINEGVPQHEIADMLKITKGSVSKAKRKAMEQGVLSKQ